ncbi:MAG: DUF4214 domain-containing protein [Actinomycetota bacterium]
MGQQQQRADNYDRTVPIPPPSTPHPTCTPIRPTAAVGGGAGFAVGRILRLLALLALPTAALIGLVVVAAPTAAADGPSRPEEGQVERLYQSVFDRPPDRGGFDYWVSLRVEGLTLRAVADGFLNSEEYRSRFGAGSDPDFVDRAYRNVLGRDGDDDGVAYWLGELSAGLARTELVLLFSESPENQLRTDTAPVALPAFDPTVSPVSAGDLGPSWRAGCPVDPDDLRSVIVDHVDFGNGHQRGEIVVHTDATQDVIEIFRALYVARYPIELMVPVDRFDGDDDRSMAANNTSGFNCRAVTGGTSWSRHAYGLAIDINPIQNPYWKVSSAGTVILPPPGEAYVDRSGYHPAMIRRGDVVVRAFTDRGWRWGGDFRTLKDWQHFSR